MNRIITHFSKACTPARHTRCRTGCARK